MPRIGEPITEIDRNRFAELADEIDATRAHLDEHQDHARAAAPRYDRARARRALEDLRGARAAKIVET